MPGTRRLIELGFVREIFCSGLARVEDIGGGCLRFYLFVNQDLNDEGQPAMVVNLRIIMPASAVEAAASMSVDAAADALAASIIPRLRERG